jgi:hypothetical protein
MSKKKPDIPEALPAKIAEPEPVEAAFAEVVGLIQQARDRALRTVNTELIDLYWSIGDQISRRVDRETGARVPSFRSRSSSGDPCPGSSVSPTRTSGG